MGKYLKFTGRVNFEKLLFLTAECDLATVLYGAATNNDASLSNKLFEYMMIGAPFIFTKLTQSLPIPKRMNAMIVKNPVSSIDLSNAIHILYNDPTRMNQISQNGRRLVATRLNWQMESHNLIQIHFSD